MKKFNKPFLKKLALLAVVACTCTVAGVSVAASGEGKAGLSSPLAETVNIGDVVQVPDYYVELDGKLVKATANILTPDGTVFAGSRFTVNKGGRYVVEYVVNNTVVHTEDCLAVMGAADMFSVNALASVEGIMEYPYLPENEAFKGVGVNVYPGAVVSFDRDINMTDFSKNEVFFEATVSPKVQGETDFQQMILTLTDSEDSASYFRITITDGHADGGTAKHVVFINGAANGQTAGGYNYDDTTRAPYWQEKNIYGTSILSSFRAETRNGESDYSIKLYYDSTEKAIYTTRSGVKSLVVDFDDPVIFGGNVWDGFDSGKANLKVSFTNMNTKGGQVIFNQIAGISLREENIVDSVAPEIKVDLGEETKAPNALLGTQYKIFPCIAEDFFDANVTISTSVLYEDVFNGMVSDVLVQNGTFVTDKLGKYTIRYVATDYSGNQSIKEVSFECIAEAEEITFTKIPSDFSVEIFDCVRIPSVNEIRAFGGNGKLNISVKTFAPNGQEVEMTDFAFIPQQLGIYKVVYTATDHYGVSASSTVRVEVLAEDKTLFMNDIVLPKLLITGFTYTIPAIEAKNCYQGVVSDCGIEYVVNGKTLDGTRTFQVKDTDTQVEVVCRALTESGVECDRLSKEITVVDGQQGKDQTAYFYNNDDNMNIIETMTSVDLIVTADSSAEFANKLRGSGFALGVNYLAEDVRFNTFNVTLTDAQTGKISVTFAFEISSNGVKITAPFGQPTTFPVANGYFKMGFDCESAIVSDANGLPVTFVEKDDAGNDFAGFGDSLYVSFSFKGVRNESKLSLSLLNNQSLGFRSEIEGEIGDFKGPEIKILGDLPVKVGLNSEITVYAAEAFDVLNQALAPTVEVQSPSGEVVVKEVVADKDIKIKVTEVGSYRVIYYAYDSQGQRTRMGQLINVLDATAPSLDVNFSNVTKSVGDTITLPSVTAKDTSGTVYCDIFITLPNSDIKMLSHSENGIVTSYPASFKVSDTEIKLETKGRYVLTIMAYDDNYNLTMKTFTITVK